MTSILILSLLFGFSAIQFYFGLFRPDFWVKFMHVFDGNRSDERFLLNNETFQMKCKIAGVAGLIGMLACGYGILLNGQEIL